MKNIKLIASDLDGTLLPYDAEAIDEEVFPLIKELQDRGIKFFAASGRQYHGLRHFFHPVANDIGYITEGGCMAFINNQMLFCEELDQDLAKEIIRAITDKPEFDVLISGASSYYIRSTNKTMLQKMRNADNSEISGIRNLYEPPEPYIKVSAMKTSGLLEKDINYWKDRFGDRCTVQVGAPVIIDMIPKNVNKATALKKVLTQLNIKPEECVAFGDGDNDREILSYVGYGVAMEKSHALVKASAKYTTDSVKKFLQLILEGVFPW